MQNLHKELVQVHKIMQDPENWDHLGICIKVFEVIPDSIVESWEHFSGYYVYPVPDPQNKMTGSEIYFSSSPEKKWDRENSDYAELRWQFLEHLIEKTKP